jgi:hypothetical protein
MNYPAFEAKEITGEALLKDRSLMELWKWASDEGQVQAVSVKGKNYAVVKDKDLVARIRSVAPSIQEYRFDEETGALQ